VTEFRLQRRTNLICDVLNSNITVDYRRKLQRVKMVKGIIGLRYFRVQRRTVLIYVGGIIKEKVGRKLQMVKTVQRYNWVKISPRIQRRKS
jgi:hypothetical protein